MNLQYCDRSCEEVADGGKSVETRLLWDEFARVVNLLKVCLLFLIIGWLKHGSSRMRLQKSSIRNNKTHASEPMS